jgi:hypothetical protein
MTQTVNQKRHSAKKSRLFILLARCCQTTVLVLLLIDTFLIFLPCEFCHLKLIRVEIIILVDTCLLVRSGFVGGSNTGLVLLWIALTISSGMLYVLCM